MKRVEGSPILEAFTNKPPFRLLAARYYDTFFGDNVAWQRLAYDHVPDQDNYDIEEYRAVAKAVKKRRYRKHSSRVKDSSASGYTIAATLEYANEAPDGNPFVAGAVGYNLLPRRQSYWNSVFSRDRIPVINRLQVRGGWPRLYNRVADFLVASAVCQLDDEQLVGINVAKLDPRANRYFLDRLQPDAELSNMMTTADERLVRAENLRLVEPPENIAGY